MRWSKAEYEDYLARTDGSKSSGPESEPIICHEPVATKAGEGGHAAGVHIRITSFRLKLCDPDNLCPKYFVDCLRYAAIISDDTPEDITLEVRQEKVKSKSAQRTEIEVELRINDDAKANAKQA